MESQIILSFPSKLFNLELISSALFSVEKVPIPLWIKNKVSESRTTGNFSSVWAKEKLWKNRIVKITGSTVNSVKMIN